MLGAATMWESQTEATWQALRQCVRKYLDSAQLLPQPSPHSSSSSHHMRGAKLELLRQPLPKILIQRNRERENDCYFIPLSLA